MATEAARRFEAELHLGRGVGEDIRVDLGSGRGFRPCRGCENRFAVPHRGRHARVFHAPGHALGDPGEVALVLRERLGRRHGVDVESRSRAVLEAREEVEALPRAFLLLRLDPSGARARWSVEGAVADDARGDGQQKTAPP